jgi:hypothetical protein
VSRAKINKNKNVRLLFRLVFGDRHIYVCRGQVIKRNVFFPFGGVKNRNAHSIILINFISKATNMERKCKRREGLRAIPHNR